MNKRAGTSPRYGDELRRWRYDLGHFYPPARHRRSRETSRVDGAPSSDHAAESNLDDVLRIFKRGRGHLALVLGSRGSRLWWKPTACRPCTARTSRSLLGW